MKQNTLQPESSYSPGRQFYFRNRTMRLVIDTRLLLLYPTREIDDVCRSVVCHQFSRIECTLQHMGSKNGSTYSTLQPTTTYSLIIENIFVMTT